MDTKLSHDDAFALIPWFVNGTLSETERRGVHEHARNCLPCRIALREQSHLEALVRGQPAVPLSPELEFDRLLQQIDESRQERSPRPRPWVAGLAAFFGAQSWQARASTIAVLVVCLSIASWIATIPGTDGRDGEFVTLSSAPEQSSEIDVVFAADTAEAQMRALVREIDGVIVDGPNDVGRYRIRLGSARGREETDAILERLRNDDRIRFAGRAFEEESAP